MQRDKPSQINNRDPIPDDSESPAGEERKRSQGPDGCRNSGGAGIAKPAAYSDREGKTKPGQ